MGKLRIVIVAILAMAIAMPMIHGLAQGPEDVKKWFKNLSNKKEKVTKLHFYFHDQVSGKNPTALKVAQSNITFTTSSTFFGLVVMIDDLLTTGPDPSSKIVGRAQGFYGGADLKEVGFVMNINLVFTEGKYNGSTLSLHGRNPVFHPYREMSIIGGSGVFRLARGIATAKTYTLNTTTGDAVVEYHVIVIHY